jgi:hypothetical protein
MASLRRAPNVTFYGSKSVIMGNRARAAVRILDFPRSCNPPHWWRPGKLIFGPERKLPAAIKHDGDGQQFKRRTAPPARYTLLCSMDAKICWKRFRDL